MTILVLARQFHTPKTPIDEELKAPLDALKADPIELSYATKVKWWFKFGIESTKQKYITQWQDEVVLTAGMPRAQEMGKYCKLSDVENHEGYYCAGYYHPDRGTVVVVCDAPLDDRGERFEQQSLFFLIHNVLDKGNTLEEIRTNPLFVEKRVDSKIRAVQKQVDETTKVLVDTVQKAVVRGANIDELDNKAAELARTSALFYKATRRANDQCPPPFNYIARMCTIL